MLSGILTKIAGPRVLLGVVVAAVLAIGFMWWQLSSAWADEATAQANATELRSELRQSEQEITDLRKEQERRESAINRALDAREQARAEAETASLKLEAALETDDCANTAHPDAVADSLRIGSGDADGD